MNVVVGRVADNDQVLAGHGDERGTQRGARAGTRRRRNESEACGRPGLVVELPQQAGGSDAAYADELDRAAQEETWTFASPFPVAHVTKGGHGECVERSCDRRD